MLSNQYLHKKVTIMGLGVNGGGVAAALFFYKQGAEVTVTDLRDENALRTSLESLSGCNIKFTLGEHKEEDFIHADLIIKNPAVPPNSKFLTLNDHIDSDISIFLQNSENPILAVTGSKGKSTTVSALQHILTGRFPDCMLGGNITVSPLSFFDEIKPKDPVILELSSWQLADIPILSVLSPHIAVITNIMHDHQNRYNRFEDYIDDKKRIFKMQNSHQFTVLPFNDFGKECANETQAKTLYFSETPLPANIDGAFLRDDMGFVCMDGREVQVIPERLQVPGRHFKLNLLIAALCSFIYGIPEQEILERTGSFRGVKHRMEFFFEKNNVRFYNDTAATIPDATTAALDSFKEPIVLITGGTDKELDFTPFEKSIAKAKDIILLAGTATEKIIPLLEKINKSYYGPYSDFPEAVSKSWDISRPGDIVLLSPGCASFGMFQNEFHRGNWFKELVRSL